MAGRATDTSARSCGAPIGSVTGPIPSTDKLTPAAGLDVSALNDPVDSSARNSSAILSCTDLATTANLPAAGSTLRREHQFIGESLLPGVSGSISNRMNNRPISAVLIPGCTTL